MKKLFAFTLAETLVVMGVIGVVAALTLPNLNQSTGNKEKVVKLQKIYSNLNDALGRATAVYGPIEEWCSGLTDANCEKRHFERITEFMKFSKQCTVSTCLGKFDTGSSDGQSLQYGVILNDGATIGIMLTKSVASSGKFYVDLDGLNKGANKHGVDYFTFYYGGQGVYTYQTNPYKDNKSPTSSSLGAADWVIRHRNMDYLKCASQLKYGGPTTCK